MIEAAIFDMDGLLLDSEVYWERARREYAGSIGCDWTKENELGAKGMNSREWAELMRERCGASEGLQRMIQAVSERVRGLYEEHLPLLPGAVSTVRSVSADFPTGIASSSPPELIEFAMQEAGLRDAFAVIVSSDTVGRGKPSPDVFLAAAAQLGHKPSKIVVFEDSSSGIMAAKSAGMRVIAVPNPHFPASKEALALADRALQSLEDFRAEMLDGL